MGDSTLAVITVDGGVVSERDPETVGKRVYDQLTNAESKKRVKRVCFADVLRFTCVLWPAKANFRGQQGGVG